MSKRSAATSRPAKRTRTSKPTARRQLARSLGVEVKYFDVGIGFNVASSVDWTGTESGNDMPQIPQGDDIFNRNGRKIQLKRVMFRGTVFTSTTSAQTQLAAPISVRVALVHNKQPNGGTNTTGQTVFGLNGGAAANAAQAIHMFQGVQGFGRFKVVDEQTLDIDTTAAVNNAGATTVSAAANQKSFTLQYRPKKPLTIEYAGSATAIPNTNSFNICANAEGTTYTPNISGVCRFYYTDV